MKLHHVFLLVTALLLAAFVWRTLAALSAARETPTVAEETVRLEDPPVAPPVTETPPVEAAEPDPIPEQPTTIATQPAAPVATEVRWSGQRSRAALDSRLARALSALKDDPYNTLALRDAATCYEEMQDTVQAAAMLGRLLELEPEDLDAHRRYADALLRDERWSAATPSLRWLAEAAPDDASAWRQLAAALLETGALTEALQACERAAVLAPEDAPTRVQRAVVRVELRDFDGALDDLEFAAERQPNDAEAALLQGRVLMETDRFDAAQACVQGVLDGAPRHVPALNRMGEIHWRRGQSGDGAQAEFAAAVDCWRLSLEIDPDQPSIAAALELAASHLASAD